MKLLTNLIFEPKGRHDPNLAYNIKDTVMNAAGNRVYFALQDVPAGIELENEEYWILQIDLSEVTGGGAVASVNGKTGVVVLSAADVGALPEDTAIPDTSAFITKAVSDLTNYYTKSQTYTRTEIDQKISAIPKFSISVVSALPSTGISATTIYLVPGGADNNLYTEYIYVNGTWEILGSQRIDLTGYATETYVGQQLAGYQPKGNYALKSEIPTVPTKVSAFENDKGYLTQHQDISGKLDASELPEAIEDALAQAKASGEFDGEPGPQGPKGDPGATGQRGTGLLPVTTAPSAYTTAVNGITPAYRIALSTVKSQASTAAVYAGDTIRYSYYHYPVIYVDSSYVYCGTRVNIRGATGAAGATPVKGTDYYTEAEKTEMVNEVSEQVGAVSYNTQALTGAQQVQARMNIGAASAEELSRLSDKIAIAPETTEEMPFISWITAPITVPAGTYTERTSVGTYSVWKKSTVSGGRFYVEWDEAKMNGFHVRCFLFDASGAMVKGLFGHNGTVLNPYYGNLIGELKDDAWLDVGTGARSDSMEVSGSFSLPLPSGYSALLEFSLFRNSTVLPDGTLTWDWSSAAEQNNTWADTWIKTGIKVKATSAKSININTNAGIDPTDYSLPILYLTGDTLQMSKDVAVDLAYKYGDLTGTASVKWQGSSSLSYPKKNYTVKFDQAFEVKEGWGAQKKYCFKANYIDHSHARNICSCKLWGEIVKSRENVPTEFANLPNGGAIDGFPCVIMLNDEFHGLYTWNIPKDGWMFGSPKAILCADAHTNATKFKALATLNGDFELEYVEDESNTGWVLTSLNRAIQAVMDCSSASNLSSVVGQYIDIPSAIDYYIHTVDESADDGTDKNYILVTFDGTKWYFSAYDRDTVYGKYWNGQKFTSPADLTVNFAGYAATHRMMYLIYTYSKVALKARANELRSGVKSEANVATVFSNFIGAIPSQIYAEDTRKWPTIPTSSASGLDQILNWYRLRRMIVDAEIEAM